VNLDANLCVKDLAPRLGVSVRYVYEMRRLGFQMHGRRRDNQTCDLDEALAWIGANGFRMVRGRGVQKGAERGSGNGQPS
jgi:hypothetical protein